MYRAIAWRALEDGVALDDEDGLGRIARTCEISFGHVEGDPLPKRVFIDGVEVTDAIRTARIDKAVSPTSAAPSVRTALVDQQRRIGAGGDFVVEGRDIGTVVFPDAAVKVFLTASDEERAHRRVRCAKTSTAASARSTTRRCSPICVVATRPTRAAPPRRSSRPKTPFASIRRATTSKRSSTRSAPSPTSRVTKDEADSSRATSPLVAAEDAVRIDSTSHYIEEVIDEICALADVARDEGRADAGARAE